MTDTVKTELRNRVLHIKLNRADKRNAFNSQMLQELSEAYGLLEDTDDAWCGLLSAEGEHFTGGLDLAEVGPKVAQGHDLFSKDGIDPLDLFGKRRSKPVVCVVQGWCMTIGIELLLASDIRVAASNTRFRQMEVNRGIMPFGGATMRMPQVAGWGNAMRYLLTGDEFDAAEALRIGIVQEVADPGEHLERAQVIAEQVAKCAPAAVRATRESARVEIEQGRAAALSSLPAAARGTMTSDDAREGMMSFIERREAAFTGK